MEKDGSILLYLAMLLIGLPYAVLKLTPKPFNFPSIPIQHLFVYLFVFCLCFLEALDRICAALFVLWLFLMGAIYSVRRNCQHCNSTFAGLRK